MVRVLVVDDDEAVSKSTVWMLEALGYRAESARSGTEALRIIAAANDFDLVLADYAMPGMRGTELANEIARRYPALPVLLVTGFDQGVDLAGSADLIVLQKPFGEEVLMENIAAALARTRNSSPATPDLVKAARQEGVSGARR